jgi:hypothetical protein
MELRHPWPWRRSGFGPPATFPDRRRRDGRPGRPATQGPAHSLEPDPFSSGAPFATDTEEIVAEYAKHLSYSEIRQVSHAIDTGAAITVEYIATPGNRTVRTLSDLARSTRPASTPGATYAKRNTSSLSPASVA